MRGNHAFLVGWVLLGSQACGGEKFESQAGNGGESGGVSTAEGGAAMDGGAGALAGAPASSGGTETGGVTQATGGQPGGGVPVSNGGSETGGVVQAYGGHPSGGVPASSGGTGTGGLEQGRGGQPSGGVPSGGVAVVAGGSSIGGAPTGGAQTGGASTGGVVTGGLSSGGRAAGGASSGGRPSGGVPSGGSTVVTGGAGTGGGGEICVCSSGLTCCNGTCVNLNNDINNCGKCGNVCPAPRPFCGSGLCDMPPCSGMACVDGGLCCGPVCCDDTRLCCNIPGPVSTTVQCVEPVNGTCPPGSPGVCASPDTAIMTPGGPRSIASLGEGELVYSVDRGRVVAVPVARTRQVAATSHHVVMRVTLANGSMLEISAPHPTADGRRFGELHAGDQLGGFAVAKVETVPYRHAFTYDILPASDSGTYFAEGALVGSTLGGRADLAISVGAP